MVNKIKLPQTTSSELAYICGILVGDGSISQRKSKNEYSIKCVGNPADEKELYYNVIGPTFNKVFHFIPKIKYQDSNTTFGFIIYSKQLFNYLTQKLGLIYGKKDQRLAIPEIFKKNKLYMINFIRGVFDTDGCITFKKRYKYKPYYPVIILSSKSKKINRRNSYFFEKFKF